MKTFSTNLKGFCETLKEGKKIEIYKAFLGKIKILRFLKKLLLLLSQFA